MSYNVYTTKGIILSEKPIREADRLYSILTRDLGLIYARALSPRKEASKLRAGLEPISLSNVSLIKGQAHWRLTSSSLIQSLLSIQRAKKEIAKSLNKGLLLLSKLVQGEEKHPELFDAVEEIFLFSKEEVVTKEYAEPLEIIFVSRILYHLGYLDKKDIPEGVVEGELNKEIFEKVLKDKRNIVQIINSGINTTNLA